jgi:alanine dehydrogenase
LSEFGQHARTLREAAGLIGGNTNTITIRHEHGGKGALLVGIAGVLALAVAALVVIGAVIQVDYLKDRVDRLERQTDLNAAYIQSMTARLNKLEKPN